MAGFSLHRDEGTDRVSRCLRSAMQLWLQIWCVIAHHDHHRLLHDEVERFAHLDTIWVICEHCGCVHRRWARGMAAAIMRGGDMAGFSLHRDEGADGRPEGIWSPYGPELTEQEQRAGVVRESFKLRPLTPKMMDHFRKMATKRVWRRNQQEDELNQEQYNECLYDAIILDWEGVYTDEEKTQPAPCTLENKMLLASLSLDRANFIVLQASLFANDDDARKAAQRDNFRQPVPVQIGSQEP
jgi:hypothetical protein